MTYYYSANSSESTFSSPNVVRLPPCPQPTHTRRMSVRTSGVVSVWAMGCMQYHKPNNNNNNNWQRGNNAPYQSNPGWLVIGERNEVYFVYQMGEVHIVFFFFFSS